MPTDAISPFPTWPSYADDEVAAAVDVLRSGRVNYWTGQEGRLFEQDFAEYIGVARAVAVSNGSVALAAALRVVGIRPGDEVIVSPRTFIASVSEIVLAGATPVFGDVDPDSQNLTPQAIEPLVNKRTRAILTVHLAGWPCEMNGIMELAAQYGLRVIEDCAQAHGATIQGRAVGSWGDIGAFSFCQDKIMTTSGEGGMLTTNNPKFGDALWSLKDHGKDYQAASAPSEGPSFRWVHHGIGTNWRLTEVQASIGRVQLRKLNDWLRLRRRNAAALHSQLASVPALRIPQPPAGVEHAYYKFYAFVRPERLKADWNRDRILAELAARGVPCGSGICPEVYLEKAFANYACRPARRLLEARALGENSLMFPVHPTLNPEHMTVISDTVKSVLAKATKGSD